MGRTPSPAKNSSVSQNPMKNVSSERYYAANFYLSMTKTITPQRSYLIFCFLLHFFLFVGRGYFSANTPNNIPIVIQHLN